MRRLLLCVLLSVSVVGPAAGAPTPRPDGYQGGDLARQEVVAFARLQVGIPYTLGGRTRRTGYDCSGLVFAAYRSIGRKIPHTT